VAYTLSDLVSRVQSRIKDTGFSGTQIKQFIDDTQNDVFNEYRLPFMQTTQNYTLAAGTADITNGSGLPTNFVQAIDLFITTSGLEKVIPFLDISTVDNEFTDPSDTTAHASNIPQYAYKYGETINVYPAPASDYTVTLRYYKRPDELTDDADTPDIPQEFRELLVVGAAYRVFQVKDNYDKAAILENKYMELLSKLAVKYSQTQVGQPTIMRINRRATLG
jgi:hypothetical protein